MQLCSLCGAAAELEPDMSRRTIVFTDEALMSLRMGPVEAAWFSPIVAGEDKVVYAAILGTPSEDPAWELSAP